MGASKYSSFNSLKTAPDTARLRALSPDLRIFSATVSSPSANEKYEIFNVL